jgi:hypothetical protein
LDLLSLEEKEYLDNIFDFTETYKDKVKCLLSNTFLQTFCKNCGLKNKIPYDYASKQPKKYCSNVCSFKSKEGRLKNSIAQKNRKNNNAEISRLAKKRYKDILKYTDIIYTEKNEDIEVKILNKKNHTTQYHTMLTTDEISYLNSFWPYAQTIKEKVFLMENNIRERPECLNCNSKLNSPLISSINKQRTIKRFCNLNCKSSSKNIRELISNSVAKSYELDQNLYLKKLKSGRKWREFVMPSGKTLLVQGYESLALNELLMTISEEDILVHKDVPKVRYNYGGIDRIHFADFYIKSTNTLIDVKSSFTFNVEVDKNNAKKLFAENQGYNYKFMIISRGKNENKKAKANR